MNWLMRHAFVMVTASALILAGCGGGGGAQDSAALEPSYLGPRVDAAAPESEAEAPPVGAIAASPRARPASDPIDSTTNGGRPSWWFDGVRASGGEVSVCAEALASDLQDARRQAVEAGRRALAQAIDQPARAAGLSVRIDQTSVQPLSQAQGGTFRYVAYVQVTLGTDDS